MLRITWDSLQIAHQCATFDAAESGQRMRVVREDGEDEYGAYRFRIVPAEVTEQCS